MKSQTDRHAVKGAGGIKELELNSDAESNVKSSSGYRNTITRDINYCLAACDQCTGLYIDSIRGDILRIICHHQCHFDTPAYQAAEIKELTRDG
ncbi:MAG: hypothetical protein WBL44_11995 [Nitrososphaeraceae archaeon]|jgi:hypothetical protein